MLNLQFVWLQHLQLKVENIATDGNCDQQLQILQPDCNWTNYTTNSCNFCNQNICSVEKKSRTVTSQAQNKYVSKRVPFGVRTSLLFLSKVSLILIFSTYLYNVTSRWLQFLWNHLFLKKEIQYDCFIFFCFQFNNNFKDLLKLITQLASQTFEFWTIDTFF